MERLYWLSRKRASLKSARAATHSKARLIHFDLAGRYSVKAAAVGRSADVASAPLHSDSAPQQMSAKPESNDV